jgi:hypothetical protein
VLLEVVLDVVCVGATPPVAVGVVLGAGDAVVVAAGVAWVVVVGAAVVVVEEVAVVAGGIGAGVVVLVVEATFAFPPQPAMARAVRMAIAVLFIAPS